MRSGGGNAHGYDVVRKYKAEGESDCRLRTISMQRAAVVVVVVTDDAAGKSPRAIAKALNARCIPDASWGARHLHQHVDHPG